MATRLKTATRQSSPRRRRFTLEDDRDEHSARRQGGPDHRRRRDFAQWLLDLTREKGFKGIVTSRGNTGLELVREFSPTAITLDISLPDISGWKVLDRLKTDLTTRHIPVFVISADDEPENALKQGAFRFLTKPIAQNESMKSSRRRATMHRNRGEEAARGRRRRSAAQQHP